MTGHPLTPCPIRSHGSRANLNLELAGSDTGSSSLPLAHGDPAGNVRRLLFQVPMPSLPEAPPPSPTFGRTTPLLEDDSTLEASPSNVTPRLIGSPSGSPQSPGLSFPSPPTSELLVIGPLSKLGQITTSLNQWSELAQCSGVLLELGNLAGLGPKAVWKLSVRIPTQNSGAVTRVKAMLSWMNFEVESTSLTFSDGSTVTQYVLKSRVRHDPLR